MAQDTRSYSQQFADLKKHGGKDLAVLKKEPHPKPSKEAQAAVPGAKLVPLSNGLYTRREERPLLDGVNPPGMSTGTADRILRMNFYARWLGFLLYHFMALALGPLTFSWRNLGIALVCYFFTNMVGICLAYHRLLTHRSFKCPKLLEYAVAWLGCMAVQGDPIEWVSNHREHHLHTDTPLDPHSPYEGFWWSHMGWLMTTPKASPDRPFLDRSNAADLSSQPFYQMLEATWTVQVACRYFMTHIIFGMDVAIWSMVIPIVVGWHAAFFVNSAAHVWGYQPYETGDLSTNNWWVAMLAGGEGWHNTHHAFPYSARHGLEWWEFDLTYCVICVLEAMGLAWDLQLPSQKQRAAKAKKTSGPSSSSAATATAPAPAAAVAAQPGRTAHLVAQVRLTTGSGKQGGGGSGDKTHAA